MQRKSCSTGSSQELNGKMFMRRSWSRRLSPKLPRRRTHDILTRSSQHRPSRLHHPDKMTVWSPSTASGDPTSPSSPTPPVGRPKRLSNIPLVPPSALHPTRLHSQKTGATAPSFQHCLQMPLVDVTFPICKLCFFQEGGNSRQNKDNCGCSVRPLKTDHGERELTLPHISSLLCCILSRHPYTIMNGEM